MKVLSHEQTQKQFREALIRQRVAEYGCSRQDAAYDLTPATVEALHLGEVMKAADAGIIIRRQVLDSMGRGAWNVLKWHSDKYPNYVPKQK